MPTYLITWIHLVAVIILLGGLISVHLVLRPALRGWNTDSNQAEVIRRVGQKFRTWTWICLITLILTGAYNMLNESGSARIETAWGIFLLLKLFLFAITVGLLLIHDFVLDPFATPKKSSTQTVNPPANGKWVLPIQQAVLFLSLSILLVATYLSSM